MASCVDNAGAAQVDIRNTVSGPGGCHFRVDRSKPHVGGNLAGGDAGTMHDGDLWPWVMDVLNPSSVLDIGCAEGQCLKFFKKAGCRCAGLDGLQENVDICNKDGLDVVLHDICDDVAPILGPPFDLVWCCDVAEHIEEAHVEKLIRLFKLGRMLMLTHGDEGHARVGWHHVNNKPEQYWVDLLKANGFVFDQALTDESRKHAHGYYSILGKIFWCQSFAL
jgi:SAM-dependent methyltransferase